MRIALVADVFPPLRSSGAVQLRDLAMEMASQGHDLTVMVADPEIGKGCDISEWNGVRVVRLRTPRTKDVSHIRRAIAEFVMPFVMVRALRKSPLAREQWDGVVWYSPSIFLGPVAKELKSTSGCRGYLIVRDIFPDWAVDVGIMRKGIPYWIFKSVEHFQYSVADVIGVQTPANLEYFRPWEGHRGRRVEVLQNWLADAPEYGCSISVADTPLKGRKIFVYAGNMGIAQGMGVLLDLAALLRHRRDVGFIFVGRGSHAEQLRRQAEVRCLDNVAFFDEIDPREIPALYAQCHVGLVALDPRHRTHNVPGKFLSYMQAGLPVLATVNPGNDLVELIEKEHVGRVTAAGDPRVLAGLAEALTREVAEDPEISIRCTRLAKRLFSADVAVQQIVSALAQ